MVGSGAIDRLIVTLSVTERRKSLADSTRQRIECLLLVVLASHGLFMGGFKRVIDSWLSFRVVSRSL